MKKQGKLLLAIISCVITSVANGQISATADSLCYDGKTKLTVTKFSINDSIYWDYETVSGWLNAVSLFSKTNNLLDTCELKNTGDYDSLRLRVIIDSSNLHRRLDTFYTNLFFYDSIPTISITNKDTSICYNGKSKSIVSVSYSKSLYEYKWYTKGETVKSWVLVNDSNNFVIRPGALSSDTFFRVVLKSKAYCGSKTSKQYSVTVADSLKKPKIIGDTTVCYNSKFKLKLIDTLTGGLGTQSWVWQVSSGSAWNSVKSNAMVLDSVATSKLSYKIIAQNSCGQRSSNEIQVDAWDQLRAASLSGDDTICFGNNPNQIKWVVNPTGGGTRRYKWEIKWKGEDWNDTLTTNLTDSTLDLFRLEKSLSIRQKTISIKGCGELYSNEVDILTYDAISTPIITTDTTICNKTTAKIDILKGSQGADGNFIYEWQVKQKNNWGSTGDTALSLSISPTNSSLYRVRTISNFGCNSVFSDSTNVTVLPKIEATVLNGDTTICFGIDYDVEINIPTKGGSGNYEQKWIWSTDSVDFVEEMASSNVYRFDNLRSTRFIQFVVKDLYGCGTVNSAVNVISIFDSIQVSKVVGDTISCYRGDVELSLNTPTSGGSNKKSEYWSVSDSKLFINPQQFLSMGKLSLEKQLNDFYVRYSLSDSVCGLFHTPTLKIDVLDSIVPDALGTDTNICYKSSFNRRIFGAKTEDGIKERYLEYSEDGQNWSNLNSVGSSEFINVTSLTDRKHYRTKIFTNTGCVSFSNNILINVYDSFTRASIEPIDSVCFRSINTAVKLAVPPNGAGNRYTTEWQYLDDKNWVVLSSDQAELILINPLIENIKIRHKTVSTYGCGTVISDPIEISVYDSFQPPKIGSSQVLCYSEPYDPILIESPALGGKGDYKYDFQLSINGKDSSLGDLKTGYKGIADVNRRIYVSVHDYCGSVTSDTVELKVNPLPDTVVINGPTEICKGTMNSIYSLDSVTGVSYEWEIDNLTLLKHESQLRILVDWDVLSESDTIRLKQVINQTGCSNVMKLPIRIDTMKSAPSLTEIKRKSNTNILIAKDSTPGLIYHWGYMKKGSREYYFSPVVDPNQRYYDFQDGIDTQNNIYFVKTFLDGCPNTSFYSFDFKKDFLDGEQVKKKIKLTIYPNPCQDRLMIHYPLGDYYIYSADGKSKLRGVTNKDVTQVDLGGLENGVYYIMCSTNQGEVIVSKFIKQH